MSKCGKCESEIPAHATRFSSVPGFADRAEICCLCHARLFPGPRAPEGSGVMRATEATPMPPMNVGRVDSLAEAFPGEIIKSLEAVIGGVDGKIAAASSKPALAMIPIAIWNGVARVFRYGAQKYALGNFLKASLADGAGERYVSATMRHLSAMQHPDGTWSAESLAARDDESGEHHIDHALCSLTMLRSIMKKDGAIDD